MKLRLTGRSYPNHDSVVVSRPTALRDVWNAIVEIHGSTRQEIALSMLSKYPCRLVCWGGLCVEVEAPEATGIDSSAWWRRRPFNVNMLLRREGVSLKA